MIILQFQSLEYMGCVSQNRAQEHKVNSKEYGNHDPKIRATQLLKQQSNPSPLNISNTSSKYALKYGKQFRQLLEPRDQILEHSFNFSFTLDSLNLQLQAHQNDLYHALQSKIKQFLVEAVSNVVSAGFKYLCKGQLEEKEAKDYTAKNIMVNLQAIYKAAIQALKNNEQLRERIDMDKVEQFLVVEMDNALNNIFINLSDSFPQSPASGGTLRMKEVITEVNRSQNDENDFLFTSGIKINDFLTKQGEPNQDGDYTSFIMKVINSVIEITQKNDEDYRQRTIFEKFTQFNEHLFWLSQQKPYHKMLNNMERKGKKTGFVSSKERRIIEKDICEKIDTVLKNQEGQIEPSRSQIKIELDQLWQSAEDGISEMKSKKQYALGQKIPAFVKTFNRQQISNKHFSAKHSSILRILTKWAGYLQQIFQNPEAYVRRRVYPFKNMDHELVEIVSWNKNGVDKLIKRLEEEYKEVKEKFTQIIKVSYGFIGKFLCEGQSVASNVCRYSQIRTISSKINSVLTSLMLDYTNILIHHLLKAGKSIRTQSNEDNLDLIVFRVSDLMRSKLQCNQASFIALLKTMYLLDNSEQMQSKFKLIRIKNRLDGSANDIIINYLFMGKVQCQLQLSIQQAKGKQKYYYIFSHFVYELTRGRFGSVAESAIMISQLDPMIAACKADCYQEKEQQIQMMKIITRKRYQGYIISNIIHQDKQNAQKQPDKTKNHRLFLCKNCSKVITNQQPKNRLFNPHANPICYRCTLKQDGPEYELNPQLQKQLTPLSQNRLLNYMKLKTINKDPLLLCLSSNGELTLHLVITISKQSRTFMVRIDPTNLKQIQQPTFDFSSLDSVDITKQINKNNQPQMLVYSFGSLEAVPQNTMNFMGFKKKQQELSLKIELLKTLFQQYREEKMVVKGIKFKVEIIKANKQEWPAIDRVCKALVLGQDKTVQLKYTKCKHLSLSNIKKLSINNVQLTQIPKWLKECYNLKVIEAKDNRITKIFSQDLPTNLEYLNFYCNGLQSIDITNLYQLSFLQVANNVLKFLDASKNTKLKKISVHYNQYLRDLRLPPSVELLQCDKHSILKLNFSDYSNLKQINIWKGHAKREELTNLSQTTRLENMKW